MSRPRPDLERGGFTLLEVIVALSIGAMVILAVRGLYAAVVDSSDRIRQVVEREDRDWNRDALLRELLARVESGTDSTRTFLGTASRLRFHSWCAAPGGWLERCLVDLAFVPNGSGVLLQASWNGTQMDLAEGPGPGAFHFLRTAANGGEWLSRWGDAITPPEAVLVTMGTTRLLLRIGERG